MRTIGQMGDLPSLVPVVEGDGEVASIPVLLPKIQAHLGLPFRFNRPLNAHGRGNLIRENGVERFLNLAVLQPGCTGILVLVDAEGLCGFRFACDIAARARALHLPVPTAVVVPVSMFEAWFLGSLASIAGHPIRGEAGLPMGLTLGDALQAEGVPNPKAWLKRHLPPGRGYHERHDQPAMTSRLDIATTLSNCRSFRRLTHAVEQLAGSEGSVERGTAWP